MRCICWKCIWASMGGASMVSLGTLLRVDQAEYRHFSDFFGKSALIFMCKQHCCKYIAYFPRHGSVPCNCTVSNVSCVDWIDLICWVTVSCRNICEDRFRFSQSHHDKKFLKNPPSSRSGGDLGGTGHGFKAPFLFLKPTRPDPTLARGGGVVTFG